MIKKIKFKYDTNIVKVYSNMLYMLPGFSINNFIVYCVAIKY